MTIKRSLQKRQGAQRVERWTCDQQVVGSNTTHGKAAYQAVSRRRWCSAAGKVTASLAESNGSLPPGGWLIVTCGLTACTPGSAQGLTLGNEDGKPLPFYKRDFHY